MLFVWRQAGFSNKFLFVEAPVTKFNNQHFNSSNSNKYKGLWPYDIHEWMVERWVKGFIKGLVHGNIFIVEFIKKSDYHHWPAALTVHFMSLRYPSTNSVLVISPSPSTSRRSNISFALILALRRPNSCPGWIHHIRRTDQLIEKFTFGSCSTPSTSSMVATMLVISCRLMQPLSSTSHILRGRV